MAKQWDGSVFFEMMAANEKAVGDLYRQLASDAALGGKFFENLAKDEDRHYKLYTALLKKHTGDLMVEVTKQKGEYLDLLIENNMLKDAKKLMAKVARMKNKDDIFEIAERAERDSVMFVEELMSLYPDKQLTDFGKVLKEEKDHLRMVMARRMESQLNVLKL